MCLRPRISNVMEVFLILWTVLRVPTQTLVPRYRTQEKRVFFVSVQTETLKTCSCCYTLMQEKRPER